MTTLPSRFALVAALTFGIAGSLPAQEPAAQNNASVQQVMGTIESLAALVENFDKLASAPAAESNNFAGQTDLRGSAKVAIARATAGAATGAAIGAMTRKGQTAVITGAIIGGIAGFVYDRLKVSAEHKAQTAYAAQEPLSPCAIPTQDPAFNQ